MRGERVRTIQEKWQLLNTNAFLKAQGEPEKGTTSWGRGGFVAEWSMAPAQQGLHAACLRLWIWFIPSHLCLESFSFLLENSLSAGFLSIVLSDPKQVVLVPSLSELSTRAPSPPSQTELSHVHLATSTPLSSCCPEGWPSPHLPGPHG